MQDTLDHENSDFSALAAEYFRMTNEKQRFTSDTDYEGGTTRGGAGWNQAP